MALSGWGASKLLLFGEHAAVYGYPAVGVALPDGVRLHVRPDGKAWRFPGIPAGYVPILDELLAHAEAVLSQRFDSAAVRALRGEVRIEATVPPGVGFGSSAAVCTALARALLPALTAPDAASIWQLAHGFEVFFHGSPSGIDTGISNLGGIQAFSFDGETLPRATSLRNPDLFLLVGAVPRTHDTRELVGRVKAAREAGSVEVQRALASLGSIAEEATDLLGLTDAPQVVSRVGELADRAQDHLRELDLSNEHLETMLSAGADAGSVGGKLSGAGGGGAFYTVFEDAAALHRAEAAVRRELDRIAVDLPLFSYRVVAGDAERITTAA
ncbi:MAG: mevalonate kinase [Spirochaetes bacterium]|jgi:mevalonate kinase|nr:mevalonate kinase [Spirochaetota bacterium]